MKQRTIRKIKIAILTLLVTIAEISLAIMIKEEEHPIIVKVILIFFLILICFEFFKAVYKEYVTLTREKHKENKELNEEELEIVKDAINLLKKVDENIEIDQFSVYKVKYTGDGWFNYDEDTHELCIFIPFKRYLQTNKDICFMLVVHEILHSQNLKTNKQIFITTFNEGINQLLTLWLIDNYSTKYKVPKHIPIIYFKFRTRVIKLNKKQKMYEQEVKKAQKIIQNSGINLKDVFFNYINLTPTFFKEFVPQKFLIK